MFYIYKSSQFGLATFQVLNTHMWLVSIVLDNEGLQSEEEHLIIHPSTHSSLSFLIDFPIFNNAHESPAEDTIFEPP